MTKEWIITAFTAMQISTINNYKVPTIVTSVLSASILLSIYWAVLCQADAIHIT